MGRLIDFFDANPDIACTIDGFSDVGNGRRRLHRLPDATPGADRLRQLLLCHCVPITNSTVTVRRTAFASVGGYDPGLKRHQDREFLVRLGRQHRIAFGKAADVLKYREANSLSHAMPVTFWDWTISSRAARTIRLTATLRSSAI
jgi:hypothetical protein